MKAVDATRILLTRKHTTARLRKQCARARETVMRSETPITADKTEGQPTEYYSSKPSDITPEERLAKRLRRATLAQIIKWHLRAARRYVTCERLAERTKTPKLRQLLELKMAQHRALFDGCKLEWNRREKR